MELETQLFITSLTMFMLAYCIIVLGAYLSNRLVTNTGVTLGAVTVLISLTALLYTVWH